jgi:hypothetical protein
MLNPQQTMLADLGSDAAGHGPDHAANKGSLKSKE